MAHTEVLGSLLFLILLLITSQGTLCQPSSDDHLFYPPVLVLGLREGIETEATATPNSISAVATRSVFGYNTSDLLPMVFFDRPGDVSIPSRYEPYPSSVAAMLFVDTGDTYEPGYADSYRRVLNVIGYRMSRTERMPSPGAADLSSTRSPCLELEGGYSTESGESPEVGRLRAEEVKSYFVHVWRIDPDLIDVLPSRRMCDSSANALVQEEARRVTIFCSDPAIVAPTRQPKVHIHAWTHLQGWIDPKASTESVERVELAFFRGDSTLVRVEAPPRDAEGLHRFTASWTQNTPLIMRIMNDPQESGLSMQGFVHMRNGEVRPTNSVRFNFSMRQGHMFSMPDTLFWYPIYFYEPAATIPTEPQREAVVRVLDSILTRVRSCPEGYRWELRLITYGDATDLPDRDAATLLRKVDAARGADRHRRERNVLVGQSSSVEIRGSDGKTVAEIGGFNRREGTEEPWRRLGSGLWYGSEPIDDAARAVADSIWTTRSAHVAAILLDSLKAYLRGPIAVSIPTSRKTSYAASQWDEERTPGYAVQLSPTPEERFYWRTIWVQLNRVVDTLDSPGEPPMRGASSVGGEG